MEVLQTSALPLGDGALLVFARLAADPGTARTANSLYSSSSRTPERGYAEMLRYIKESAAAILQCAQARIPCRSNLANLAAAVFFSRSGYMVVTLGLVVLVSQTNSAAGKPADIIGRSAAAR